MRNELPSLRFAAYALCAIAILASRAYGQDRFVKEDFVKDQIVTNAPSIQASEPTKEATPEVKPRANGVVNDWSTHHALYPRIGPLQSLIKVQNDPRAIQSWQAISRQSWRRSREPHPVRAPQSSLKRDWNISLSALSTNVIPNAIYPAKYTAGATPDCVNDYVAFPVNGGFASQSITGTLNNTTTVMITAGTITSTYVGQPITGTGIPTGDTIASISGGPPATSLTLSIAATGAGSETLAVAGQPNLVVLNNLYSGTTGGTGVCNRTSPVNDDGVSATVYASYYLHTGPGQISTSPTLSPDGSKILVVESAPGQQAWFEVVAPNFGTDGVDPNNAQDALLSPELIACCTNPPSTGESEAITLGANPISISSPFVVYPLDQAYVGDDGGNLYRVMNVFCDLPACITNRPEMALDPGFGSGGVVVTGCGGVLTGPVYDYKTSNVFVGCSNGDLYGFTNAGVPLTGSPIVVGGGGAHGGIVDPPLVDVVNGYIYAVSGNNGTAASAVVVQILDSGTTMTLESTAALTGGGRTTAGEVDLHAPAFNEAYFSDPTSTDWLLYESTGAGDSFQTLWGIGFNGSRLMNSGNPTDNLNYNGLGPGGSSPLTSFLNGSVDYLFLGFTSAFTGDSNVYNFVITGGTFPTGSTAFAQEGTGTTGIVVDNDSTDAQASSLYFGVFGGDPTHTVNSNSAVKLTQSALQ